MRGRSRGMRSPGFRAAAAGLVSALVAVAVAVIPLSAASADPPTGGSTIVAETFAGASVADPGWTVQGDACLTGAPAGSTPPVGAAQIPNCSAHRTGGAILPGVGTLPGYLQLTDLAGNTRGSVLYNRPVPASAGISITFDQFQYGGNGADGIGFFLVDGSTSLTQPGAPGGSLGYAQRNAEPGIVGGYLGVGLDAYGNFWNDGEGRGAGCPEGQRSPTTSTGPIAPNVISLRGPGQGTTGYCLLGATVPQPVTNPTKPGTTLDGGTGTLRAATQSGSLRTVNIQVTPVTAQNPVPRVIVQVRYTPGGPWITELDIPAPPNTPSTYKFGLSASTGGNNDVHLVRQVNVQTIVPLAALQLEKQVDRTGAALPAVITAGTAIPYQYTVTNAGTAPVSSLTIADDRIAGPIVCAATTLQPAPAPDSSTTCRGTYVVTPADVAAGAVTNVAVANASSQGGTVASPQATVTVPLTSSIALTKAVTTPGPYAVGQQVAYQYVVRNTGGSTLTTFSLQDDRMGTNTVTCQAGTLAAGTQMTCSGSHPITAAQLNAQGYLVNTATVTALTPIGQTVTSSPATAQIPVATDVGVTKTVDDATPVVGDDVTFTVTATNYGPSPATQVVVSDPIPDFGPDSRLVYVSSVAAAGTTYLASTGAWAIPGIPVGDSLVLTIRATVQSVTAITNAATRTGMSQIDINPSNDTASVTLNPIVPTADLAVTKAVVGDSTIPVGGSATFRLTVQNLGPFAATGVSLLDQLPSSLPVSGSTGDGSYDPATGVWTIGPLAVGQTVTRDITVRGTLIDTYTNLAVIRPGASPRDPNPSNDSASATLVVRAPIADLSVVKNVFPQSAVVGDTVTYQVVASNLGPEPAAGAYVDDVFPAGVTVTGTTVDRGSIDPVTGRWVIGPLAPGDIVHAKLTATVTAAGTQVNTATINDPSVSDPDEDNNSSSATLTTGQPTVDVGVTKSLTILRGAPVTRVPLDSVVEFTLEATNHPLTVPATATNVLLVDRLPANLTFVSATGDGSYDPATGRWSVGTLPPGATATLVIRAIAAADGHATNTVGLESLTENDADPSNNSNSVQLDIIRLADLEIGKSVAPTVARPGQIVTYTVVVSNHGPNDSLDSYAFDPQMPAADIVGFDAPPGTTFDPASRVWLLGPIPVDTSLTLTVDVRVTANPGWFENHAVVDDRATVDPDLTNNESAAQLNVPAADIRVDKSVDKPQATLGDTVTFVVSVTNLGPDQAGAVEVQDLLPTGLTLLSASPTSGVYDPASGVWSLPSLDPVPPARALSPQETLTIQARADTPGTFVNTAASDRSTATPYDPDPSNNSQSAVVTVGPAPAALAVSKSVDPASARVGDAVRYTLTVSNAGPGIADDVVLRDRLPDGITALTATAPCTLSGNAVSCTWPSVGHGMTEQVTVTARADVVGTLDNTATATTSSPNLTPEAGTATATVAVLAAQTGGGAGEGTTLSATGSDLGPAAEWAALLVGTGVLIAIAGGRRRRPGSPRTR